MEETEEFYLHYVGKSTYDLDLFKKEAKKYGVSRALPLNMVQALNFGDVILLARFDGYKVRDKDEGIAIGDATIFGYFVVTGVSFIAPKEFHEELHRRISVHNCEQVNTVVNRGCGSYTVNSQCETTTPLPDIIKKAKELKEKGYSLNKVFVNGEFHEFKHPFKLFGIPFSRSLIKVQFPKDKAPTVVKPKKGMVYQIVNYRQRKRLNRRQREALLAVPLTQFVG